MIQTIPSLDELLAIPARVAPIVQAHRQQADAERRLPAAVVEALRGAGAFRLSTPTERGGWELPLHVAGELYEAFGRLDGPVAWTVWNGNLGFSAALLSEPAADRIWHDDGDPIIVNSARPAGGAVEVAGGFRLSGRWDLVSAIDTADWVALFGLVLDHGAPRFLAPGVPDLRAFYLPRTDVAVEDTWHSSGMRATGSNTAVVDAAFVPGELAISPFQPARIDRPLYRVPAFTIASSGVAPIVVGMAQAAIEEVVSLAPTKPTDNGQPLSERAYAHSRLGAAQTHLDAARALLNLATRRIDDAAAAAQPVSERLRAGLRAAMSHAGATAREVFATCAQLASSSAVYHGQPVERIVRDGSVATQHMLLADSHLDILGRLLLGLDAGTPVV